MSPINNGISLALTTATCVNSRNNKTIMCTNMTADINTAPRLSSEPSGNNLVLISKRRWCSVGKTQEEQKRLINRKHPASKSGRHQKCFSLSCNARKEALCLTSVTYMTRDINDTFVTNHPGDRKPSFAGSWRNTIMISHIQHKTIYFFRK